MNDNVSDGAVGRQVLDGLSFAERRQMLDDLTGVLGMYQQGEHILDALFIATGGGVRSDRVRTLVAEVIEDHPNWDVVSTVIGEARRRIEAS